MLLSFFFFFCFTLTYRNQYCDRQHHLLMEMPINVNLLLLLSIHPFVFYCQYWTWGLNKNEAKKKTNNLEAPQNGQ